MVWRRAAELAGQGGRIAFAPNWPFKPLFKHSRFMQSIGKHIIAKIQPQCGIAQIVKHSNIRSKIVFQHKPKINY